ncbi:hypothetical protein E2C01_022153 [Portunus trituberculatus]|uniref:Uncharacterized protein n=1 Tax=Portunus trituberculatus TaxID=210409 RepID=A0A5B7E6H4_PORTR|nr:hypothetical protein [Portunus trituberculatus]
MIGLVSGETLTVGGGSIVGKGPLRLPATENTGMQDHFPVSRHIYAQSAEKGRQLKDSGVFPYHCLEVKDWNVTQKPRQNVKKSGYYLLYLLECGWVRMQGQCRQGHGGRAVTQTPPLPQSRQDILCIEAVIGLVSPGNK